MVLKVGLCGQSFAWHASRMRRQTDRRVVTISSRRRPRPSTPSCAWCGCWRNYATWRRGRSRDDSAESSHAKLIGNLALCTYLLPAALREFVNFKGGNSPERRMRRHWRFFVCDDRVIRADTTRREGQFVYHHQCRNDESGEQIQSSNPNYCSVTVKNQLEHFC